MTWSEFQSAVRVHLVAHNRRQGIQSFIDANIKAAVWDLQAGIPALLSSVRRKFSPSMFYGSGTTGQVALTPNASLLSVIGQHPDHEKDFFSYDLATTPTDVFAVEQGLVGAGDKICFYVPRTGRLTVSPNPKDDGTSVFVEFVAKNVDFESEDEVVFDFKVAEVVADYVQARLARSVDHDLASAQSFDGTYRNSKRVLRSEYNESLNLPALQKGS